MLNGWKWEGYIIHDLYPFDSLAITKTSTIISLGQFVVKVSIFWKHLHTNEVVERVSCFVWSSKGLPLHYWLMTENRIWVRNKSGYVITFFHCSLPQANKAHWGRLGTWWENVSSSEVKRCYEKSEDQFADVFTNGISHCQLQRKLFQATCDWHTCCSLRESVQMLS